MPKEMLEEQKKQEVLKKEQQEKNNGKEQKKEELAKAFGLSLADIEHVQLDNGKEFFKFYNPQERTVKMIEDRNDNTIERQFKDIQQELSYTQSNNAKGNAKEIYEYSAKYNNIEVDLIPIEELRSNRFKYMKEINRLSTIDRKKVMVLLKASKELELKYINLENAFAIDSDNRVIDVRYDYNTNKAEIRSARVLNYQDHKEYVDEDNYVVELSEIDFDNLVTEIDVTDEIPTITDSQEINVRGESIKPQQVIDYYNMPEALEKADITPKQRKIYEGLVAAIKRKIERISMIKQSNKQKVLVNTNNNQAA